MEETIIFILKIAFVIVAALTSFLILLQEGKGGGLAALGGTKAASVEGVTNPIRRATGYLSAIFFLLAIILGCMAKSTTTLVGEKGNKLYENPEKEAEEEPAGMSSGDADKKDETDAKKGEETEEKKAPADAKKEDVKKEDDPKAKKAGDAAEKKDENKKAGEDKKEGEKKKEGEPAEKKDEAKKKTDDAAKKVEAVKKVVEPEKKGEAKKDAGEAKK